MEKKNAFRRWVEYNLGYFQKLYCVCKAISIYQGD